MRKRIEKDGMVVIERTQGEMDQEMVRQSQNATERQYAGVTVIEEGAASITSLDEQMSAIADFERTQVKTPVNDTDDQGDILRTESPEIDCRPTCYRWFIPCGRGVIPIEIEDADSVESARTAALAYKTTDEHLVESGLTATEASWVQYNEPMVVRDRDAIPLAHWQALAKNEQLEATNATLGACKAAFETLDIDPSNPGAWMNGVELAAQGKIDQAKAAQDAFAEELADSLVQLQAQIRVVARKTRFAPADPTPESEPDYSVLTIVAPDGILPIRYHKLSRANWVNSLEVTDEVRAGLHLLLDENVGMIPHRRMFEAISEDERETLRVVSAWIKAVGGV